MATARGYATGAAGSYSYTLVNPVSLRTQCGTCSDREENVEAVCPTTNDRLTDLSGLTQST